MSTSNPQPLVYDDYCLATKWNDGDARDPWVVGFYREKASRHPPEFSVVADNSVSTKTGFRRCQKITREQGNYLLANAKELEEAGVKLWELLSTLNPSQSSEARLTADDIQPGPYSEDHLRQSWDNQADEYNQWGSLDLDEKLAWAQNQAIAHGGLEHQCQDSQLQPSIDGEVAEVAAKADADAVEARAAAKAAEARATAAKAALEEARAAKAAAWEAEAQAKKAWQATVTVAEAQAKEAMAIDAGAAHAMAMAADARAMAAPKTEAAELADELTWLAGQLVDIGWSDYSGTFTLAAELLQRQAAPQPQPIPVSERLPEATDCDAEGRCWWFAPTDAIPGGFRSAGWGFYAGHIPDEDTHWLPAHALPQPSEEVK